MFTTQLRPFRSPALIAGLVAAIALTASHSAFATLVIDLRFSSSATDKTLDLTTAGLSAGSTVTIQVWATITGTNGTVTDEGLSSTFYGLLSANATANLAGNLTAASLVAPFDAAPPSTQLGTFNLDRNADGISDWRGSTTTTATDWPKSGAGSTTMILGGGVTGQASASDPTNSWEFHIGDAVFTIGSLSTAGISGTQTVLAYNPQTPSPVIASSKATWREDNVNKSGTPTQPGTGTGVTFTLTVGGGGGNPDIDPTPTSLNFGNLLLNAALPPSQNVTLTNNGNAAGSYSTSTTGVAAVTSGATGGPLAASPGPGNTALMGVGLAAGTTTTYGANKPGTVVVATTGDPDSALIDTVTVTVTVGEAQTAGTAFGAALTGNVAAAGNYLDLASRTTAGGGNLGTEARLLGGSNATGGTETLSMRWRQRTAAESTAPASPPLPANTSGEPSPLISDVVELTGLDFVGGGDATGRTDPYVLQMSYDPNALKGGPGTEALKAAAGSIFLAWLDPTGGQGGVPLWRLATAGNFNNNPAAPFNFQGSYGAAGSPTAIGSWGVDIAANTVWAVLDHASEFGVVPEPSSLALLGLGAIGLVVGLRRRRR